MTQENCVGVRIYWRVFDQIRENGILGLNGEEKDLKAGSITNVLQQALHSRDKKQLAKILNYTDQSLIKVHFATVFTAININAFLTFLIRNIIGLFHHLVSQETVKNVPPPLAPVLMTEVCHRLQSAPERALASSRWLRTTLQYHSAPLAAASHEALET